MPTLTRASFADGGGRLVLAHDDDTIRLWSIEGEPLSDPVQIKGRAVGAGFLLGGKRVYALTAAGVLHLFDGERLEPVIDPVSQQAGFLLAAPSDDGKLLFAADSANQVHCFGAEDGAKVGGPVVHRAAVTTIVAPAGGRLRTMLTGSADGLARAWVLPAGQPGTEYAHGAPIRALGVAPRCLWTLGDDETVRLFDLATGRPLRDPLPSKRVTAAASLGELLITGSRDGSIRGWKLPSGDEAAGMALRVEAAVLALQLSADRGTGLLVLAGDGPAMIFAGNTPEVAARLKAEGRTLEASFDPLGQTVATLGSDRMVRLWEAGSGRSLGRPIRLGAGLAPERAPGPPARIDGRTITRLGQDRVVAVDGVLGLFTPISSGRETPATSDEKANLIAIIDQLRREVTDLQTRNLRLEQELRTLRERPAAAEDLAIGLQQSLDDLQSRMAAMRNSTSNFAVRQFRLDASVTVEVSPLGRVGYRFLQPGEAISAEAVSKLGLELVPLPKETLAGVFTRDLFVPDRSLDALPEMTAPLLDRFEQAGVYSIGDYLQVGTRARAQVWLESFLGVERRRLAAWAQQALLLTLAGMSGPAALVLIRAGAGTFEALAGLTPEALLAVYEDARVRPPAIEAPTPPIALVRQWQRGARQYLGLEEQEPDMRPPEPPSDG